MNLTGRCEELRHATLIMFPVERLTRARRVQIDEAWAIEINGRLEQYAGWIWRDSDGVQRVPGWVGDAWARFVMVSAGRANCPHPDLMSWPALWIEFTECHLADHPEWRARVEQACGSLQEAA